MRLTVDVYHRATPETLALAASHPALDRNRQLATLDSLADSWRTVGYLVGWIAPGVIVATDDTLPLTVRGMALTRDADEHYPMSPDDAHDLVGRADVAAALARRWESYHRSTRPALVIGRPLMPTRTTQEAQL